MLRNVLIGAWGHHNLVDLLALLPDHTKVCVELYLSMIANTSPSWHLRNAELVASAMEISSPTVDSTLWVVPNARPATVRDTEKAFHGAILFEEWKKMLT